MEAAMQIWHAAVKSLKLEELHFVPYSLRRGGATTAYHNGETLDALVTKGRWQSVSTAQSYLDCGLQALFQLSLPSTSRTAISAGVKSFFDLT